ncbi:MAG: cysteine protease StiP family protein [Azoarcus sp.]|jgi:hypothetical protein|nr:cysteine protease StiP family protein [Azoarcus sp.]
MRFHGSYRPDDVEFLLKPIEIAFIEDFARKEALIQSGQRHYSEMLSPEQLPSAPYMALFHRAHAANRERLARDCLRLTRLLLERHGAALTLVSLARAGTPIGAIVRHLAARLHGVQPAHYAISIIRDRGIDTVALQEILARGHAPEGIAFVDGWTGKGVISRELNTAIARFNAQNRLRIDPGLNVLADLAGTAARAASGEDYLIASSILNATVSGLVSRSILNEAIGPGDYHGCVHFTEFAAHDLSRWFVDDIVNAATRLHEREGEPPPDASSSRAERAAVSRAYMAAALRRHGIADENLVKPGIGEATRVLLRRFPERVIVREAADERIAHLVALAGEKQIPINIDPTLPYHAVSIIRNHKDA